MVGDIRNEMIAATEKAGRQGNLAEGPFGRGAAGHPHDRPKGNRVVHISRTWFAEGPRWDAARSGDGEAGRRRVSRVSRNWSMSSSVHGGPPRFGAAGARRPDPDDAAELGGHQGCRGGEGLPGRGLIPDARFMVDATGRLSLSSAGSEQ
jgi:hypothetical protein